MGANGKTIYNTDMYKISESPTTFKFETKRGAFDKGSLEGLYKYSKKYYKQNSYTPTVNYPKKDYTADSADKKFNEDLKKGITIKTYKQSGKFEDLGVLSMSKGKLHFEFEKKQKAAEENETTNPSTEEKATEGQQIVDYSNSKPAFIVDPNSAYAKALIGKNVEIARTFNFTDAKRAVLTEIFSDSPMPFTGKTIDDGRQISGVFIREYRIVRLPLDLNDKAVRDSLRGKWIFNKVTGQECLVSSFRKENGHYVCNGLDARTLMNSWELENGGFLGIEK